MANHAIRLQSFEDNIDIHHLQKKTNRQVIQTVFDHSVFSRFAFLRYHTKSKNRDPIIERVLRVVADGKEKTPVNLPELNQVPSSYAKEAIINMIKNNEKQRQLFIEINGQVIYAILVRSAGDDKLFFAFSGFALNLLKQNFPTKSNLEAIIHQYGDDTNWYFKKEGERVIFKKIESHDIAVLLENKVVFDQDSRFRSNRYFSLQVVAPQVPILTSLFPLTIFIAGLIITGLLVFILYYLVTRNIRIHQMVKDRTCELEEETIKSKEAAVAKSRFLANISHEIRTPLNIVLGMADLLQETPLSSTQKNYLESIDTSGRHLLNLINDILDMTRVDLSDVVLKNESLDLLKFLEESSLAVDELARNKNLDLYMDLDPNLPKYIQADGSRLRQILINLLTNAVKYTEKGFVEFSALGSLDTETGIYNLEFRVKDSGVGISEKDQEEIFKAFYQVNSTIKRSQGGVGLGLSIVASIVKRLDGRVDVESSLGIGSTFSVTLPIHEFSKESWTTSMCGQIDASKDNIFISTDAKLTQTFIKYMKAFNASVKTYNHIQKIPLELKAANRVFIDLEFSREINPSMLNDLLYDTLICIGEPSSLWKTLGEEIAGRVELWPNKLLLPSKLFTVISNPVLPTTLLKKVNDKNHLIEPSTRQDVAILIVDDGVSNKLLFEAYCASQSWHVNFAANGQEAIENYLRRQHFDILITDLQMPVMDGFTLIQQLKGEEKALYKPSYTIVLSADSTEETMSMSKSLKVDDFLAKPIRKAEFIKAIDRGIRALDH